MLWLWSNYITMASFNEILLLSMSFKLQTSDVSIQTRVLLELGYTETVSACKIKVSAIIGAPSPCMA